MKKKIISIFLSIIIIAAGISSVSACTGFIASEGEDVLVASNEDWWRPEINIRFLPGENGKYGRVIFEYNNRSLPQDPSWDAPFLGVNDQGLFCDVFLTPYNKILNNGNIPVFFPTDHYIYSLFGYLLSVCSTVHDVVDIIYDYDMISAGHEDNQLLFVDRNGDSVIFEGDDLVYKEGNFQVVTNFLQTHPELGGYPCWRYEIAVSMLENMTELSMEYFRDICNATHQERRYYPTTLSQVCDLKNGIIYLYNFHDYTNVLTIKIQEELEKGEHVWYNVPSLFEPEGNQPPNKPQPPYGETSGYIKTEYTYKVFDTTDPDNKLDEIYYQFDWGDGTYSKWYNRYWVQGNEVTHSWWKKGKYEVRVKAMDIYCAESEWSDSLEVIVPKNKGFIFNFPLLNWLFEHFPNAFPILQYLLEL